jgi:hypothetical protein
MCAGRRRPDTRRRRRLQLRFRKGNCAQDLRGPSSTMISGLSNGRSSRHLRRGWASWGVTRLRSASRPTIRKFAGCLLGLHQRSRAISTPARDSTGLTRILRSRLRKGVKLFRRGDTGDIEHSNRPSPHKRIQAHRRQPARERSIALATW